VRRAIRSAQGEEQHLEENPHARTENPIGDEQDERDPGRDNKQFEKSEEWNFNEV
jgi:hypothetical protein